MSDCPAIEARQLCRSYNGKGVLDGVDLSLAVGETMVVMGSNGAGKTTLLRCLAGTIRPTSGRVLWFGREPAADPEVRRWAGIVGHQSYLYGDLTVQENLLFAAGMCDVPNPGHRVARLLEAAGLRSLAGRPAGRLSRGQRQRVAIVRAMVHEPRILLWDEPFTGLDDQATAWLVAVIAAQRQAGRATCLVLHDAGLARHLADRIVVIRAGRLEESAPAAQDAPENRLRVSA